ncbi:hypothetical protein C5B42_02895 [Candidatus Cerribacteria bacterium 'Amazon FNV 2010 28 9']|uniref:non-specific serine/threonine protein kinase n=1 Tax=Candidatus Cerribacteria bacterium 'Amazon FNV 2010 28 9' TaxID=2081795 RepID=A0A317JU01_9BACT|nr:MAG: hypothetical protein C5B42_02895 [Candidatus Cerribacteria bacterium 'Amazon FNV 2010 28 9']
MNSDTIISMGNIAEFAEPPLPIYSSQDLERRYQRIGTLSISGGLGTVEKALDIELQRFVAVKHPTIDPSYDASAMQREAKQHARVDSIPGIAKIYAYGLEENVPFIVMEWIDAPTIADRLKTGSPLSLIESVMLASDMSWLAEEMAKRGVIHADWNTKNVFWSKENRIRLVDFGIAVGVIDRQQGAAGTLSFVAPEVLDQRTPNLFSEQWSIAAVVYASLVGRGPFDQLESSSLPLLRGKISGKRTRDAIIEGKYTPLANNEEFVQRLRRIDEPLSQARERARAIDAVFTQVFSQDSRDRFPTIQAFVQALQDACGFTDEEIRTPRFPLEESDDRVHLAHIVKTFFPNQRE